MYMDKNYIIYPKDSYTQITGLDREHLTQQYVFAQRESDAAIYRIVKNTREKRDEKPEFLHESDLRSSGDHGCAFLQQQYEG